MRKWFPADSFLRRRAGMLFIAATMSIAASVAVLQSYRSDSRDAGAGLAINEPAAANAPEPVLEQPETSIPGLWKIPQAKPRDRSNRPLLELVGVYTGTGLDGTALIREKEGRAISYRVGDRIAGNRELIEVHDTYVLLRNDDYVERLRLGNRPLERRYRAEDLQSWAGQLIGRPRGASDQAGDNR